MASIIKKSPDSFLLMYCGVVLRDDDQPLSSHNIRPTTASVHVFPKPPVTSNEARSDDNLAPKMSDDEMQQFMIAFGMAVRNPAFNRVVQRLKHRESLENLVAACPDLAKDPVSCAFLTKPELLISLLDQETLKYVSERHPGLVEAANYLAAAVHEEKPASSSEAGPSHGEDAAAPFAYNLDDMSDDDEEMEAAAGPAQRNMPANRGIITPDQLAAALASAQQGSLMGGMTGLLGQSQPRHPTATQSASSMSSAPSSSSVLFPRPTPSTSGASGGFITSDQLAAALAAASTHFASAAQPARTQAPPPPSAASTMDSNLARMREMGIIDEGLARQALVVMEGDLQAAIDLIFSGWEGEDDSAR